MKYGASIPVCLFYIGITWRLLFVLDKHCGSRNHLPLTGKFPGTVALACPLPVP